MNTIQTHIHELEATYTRGENSVLVLAASKHQSVENILSLYQQGQRHFGENYLQEALSKMPLLPNDIIWHFIGSLQSNKIQKIAEHFSWVHSVASTRIAERLNAKRPTHLPPLNICLEINIDHEATKSGVAPNEASPLAKACLALPHLHLRGLMCLPTPQPTFDLQRKSFHQLNELYQQLQNDGLPLDTLSMGTSADYEAAIAEGATIVRLGELLFGQRPKSPRA
jgi:pyridoxal phosphate enzyme (YggS family)